MKFGLVWFWILSLFFQPLAFAFAPDTYASPSSPRANLGLSIPAELGRVVASFQGTSLQRIILIKDLHCNAEVQKNIAGLLHRLAEKHGFSLVGMEGASVRIPVEALSTMPVEAVRRQLAGHFLEKGRLTGAEYAAAVTDPKLILQGVESPILYEQSRDKINLFMNDASQGICRDWQALLEDLKPRIFSPALLYLDRATRAWKQTLISPDRYQARLAKLGRQIGFPLPDFPPAVTPEGRKTALEKSQLALREHLYTTLAQRRLDQYSRALEISERMLNLSATPEDCEVFQSHPERFALSEITAFLKAESRQIEPLEMLELQQSLAAAMDFYRLATQRSRAMVVNLIHLLQPEHPVRAVLIAGGFHQQEIERLLRAQNISFVTVEPALARPDLPNPYFSLLRNHPSPLEQLLARAENQFALSPALLDVNFKRILGLLGEIQTLIFHHRVEKKPLPQSLAEARRAGRGWIRKAWFNPSCGYSFLLPGGIRLVVSGLSKPARAVVPILSERISAQDVLHLVSPPNPGHPDYLLAQGFFGARTKLALIELLMHSAKILPQPAPLEIPAALQFATWLMAELPEEIKTSFFRLFGQFQTVSSETILAWLHEQYELFSRTLTPENAQADIFGRFKSVLESLDASNPIRIQFPRSGGLKKPPVEIVRIEAKLYQSLDQMPQAQREHAQNIGAFVSLEKEGGKFIGIIHILPNVDPVKAVLHEFLEFAVFLDHPETEALLSWREDLLRAPSTREQDPAIRKQAAGKFRKNQLMIAGGQILFMEAYEKLLGREATVFLYGKIMRSLPGIVQDFTSEKLLLYQTNPSDLAFYIYPAVRPYTAKWLELVSQLQIKIHAFFKQRYRISTLGSQDQILGENKAEQVARLVALRNRLALGDEILVFPHDNKIHLLYPASQASLLERALRKIKAFKQKYLFEFPYRVGPLRNFNDGFLPSPVLAMAVAFFPDSFATLDDMELAVQALLLKKNHPQGKALTAWSSKNRLPEPGELQAARSLALADFQQDSLLKITSRLQETYQGVFENWFLNTIQYLTLQPAAFKELTDLLELWIEKYPEMLVELDRAVIAQAVYLLRDWILEDQSGSPEAVDLLKRQIAQLVELWDQLDSEQSEKKAVAEDPKISAVLQTLAKMLRETRQTENLNRLLTLLRDVQKKSEIPFVLHGGRIKSPFSIYMNFRRYWDKHFKEIPNFTDPKIFSPEAINQITDDILAMRITVSPVENMEAVVNQLAAELKVKNITFVLKTKNIEETADPHGRHRLSLPLDEAGNPPLYFNVKIKIPPQDGFPFAAEIMVLPDLFGHYATRPAYATLKKSSFGKQVVAIRGDPDSAKLNLAQKLAKETGYQLLDIGRFYRLLALLAYNQTISPDSKGIQAFVKQITLTHEHWGIITSPDLEIPGWSEAAAPITALMHALSDYPPTLEKIYQWINDEIGNRDRLQGVIVNGRDPFQHLKNFDLGMELAGTEKRPSPDVDPQHKWEHIFLNYTKENHDQAKVFVDYLLERLAERFTLQRTDPNLKPKKAPRKIWGGTLMLPYLAGGGLATLAAVSWFLGAAPGPSLVAAGLGAMIWGLYSLSGKIRAAAGGIKNLPGLNARLPAFILTWRNGLRLEKSAELSPTGQIWRRGKLAWQRVVDRLRLFFLAEPPRTRARQRIIFKRFMQSAA